MEIVIVNFEILFKYPTWYDYFKELGGRWFVDPASGVGSFFTQAYKTFLEYIFNFDNEFWNTCNHVFQNISKFAFGLIPLVIILTIARTMRIAAGNSVRSQENIRSAMINLLVNIGLAVSCGFIAKQIIMASSSLGIHLLQMSGVKIVVQNGIVTNMDEVARYIFLLNAYTFNSGIGFATDTVLLFMRLFFMIVLTISLAFTGVSIRVGLTFLFVISSLMFVAAGYEELEWVRDMWLKGFISLALMPTVVSIIITIMLTINYQAEQQGIPSIGDALKLILMSTALALIIAMIQSFILTQILDYSISTVRNSVRSVANFIPNTVAFALAVKNGGIKGGLSKAFGIGFPRKGGNPGSGPDDEKALPSQGQDPKANSSKTESEGKENKSSDSKSNSGSGSLGGRISGMEKGYKKKYGLSDDEINDPANDKNKKVDEEMKHAYRAYSTVSKVFKNRNNGSTMTAAAQNSVDPFQTDYLNSKGGADMALLGNAMDTAAYRGTHGGQGIPRHSYENDMYGYGFNADDSDAFNNISRVTDWAIDWSASGFDDQQMYDAVNNSFDAMESSGKSVSFFS